MDLLDRVNDQELRFKVECIKTMSSVLLDARDTFFDFPRFVEHVESLWRERNRLLEEEHDERKATDIQAQLEAAFEYFEIGYRQRLAGSYSELFTGTRMDFAFPGSISDIIKAADYLCARVLQSVDRPWPGFAVFSVVRSLRAVSAAIVVFGHSYLRRADFVQDWLISAHEIGHIYYWNARDLVKRRNTMGVGYGLTLSELVADAFCHEHGHLGDSDMFIKDLVFSQAYSVPVWSAATEYGHNINRMFAAWLYVEIRRKEQVRDKLNNLLANETQMKAFSDFLDFLLRHYTVTTLPKERRIEIVDGVRRIVDFRNSLDEMYKFLVTVSDICEGSFFGGICPKELLVPRQPVWDEDEHAEMADRVTRGEIIENVISHPFAFLRALRYACERGRIELDDPGKNQHVRAAAILSLSNSYELTR